MKFAGQPLAHESANAHVTGSALYTDDLVATFPGILHAWPVLAPHAHALLSHLDASPALNVPGVVATLTGPADLELITPERAFLRRGLMIPYVPPSARGFTVLSPQGQVVDLGTQFALRVGKGGGPHLHVIEGKVAVATGAMGDSTAKSLTTGYAARMESSADAKITQVPLLIDTFAVPDGTPLNADLSRRQCGFGAPIGYVDLDREAPSAIRGGRLAIPMEGRLGRSEALSRVVLDRDFRELVGRRYTISFKVKLPEIGTLSTEHWVGFLLVDRKRERPERWLPPGYKKSETNLCVFVHPNWQVGAQVHGQPLLSPQRVFARSEAAGPYQIIIRVDETTADTPLVDVDANGIPIVAGVPLSLGAGRFLGFETFLTPHSGVHGWGYVYDLCLSIDSDAVHPLR